MLFWSIVLGCVAVLLLLGWRTDRRNVGTGRLRRRKIYDAVRIEESKQQLNRMETDRWGVFRGYDRR